MAFTEGLNKLYAQQDTISNRQYTMQTQIDTLYTSMTTVVNEKKIAKLEEEIAAV